MSITERLFPTATADQLRAAATACRTAGDTASDATDWDAPEAAEAQRLTNELGWAWDFEDWHHAAQVLEREVEAIDSDPDTDPDPDPETETFAVEMHDETGSTERIDITANDVDDARDQAVKATRDWVRGGDWGQDGAAITAYWTLFDADDDEVDEGSVSVTIEPDHDALIERAGGSIDCDHDWTSEGEGGCRENPGVFGGSGTAMSFHYHCRTCGLHKIERSVGNQRNPGDHDSVEYVQPESWCEECQREECGCEGDGGSGSDEGEDDDEE